MKNNCIILVGMMGSGKSTVGRLLATLLKGSFLDLDRILEFKTQMTIPQLFKEKGESVFRRYETEVLKSLILPQDLASVLATGGGVVLKPENRELLKRLGHIVWLKVSPETVLERLSEDAERPLLNALNKDDKLLEITKIVNERESFYKALASQTIQVDGEAPEEIVKKIIDYTF